MGEDRKPAIDEEQLADQTTGVPSANVSGSAKGNELVVFFAEREEAFALVHQLSGDLEHSPAPTTALERLTSIFYKYLECPTLLDGSLEELVVLLGEQWLVQHRDNNNNNTTTGAVLLDVLYTLTTVRGSKVVQRFLPHALATVKPVWEGLQQYYRQKEEPNKEGSCWKSAYCLWIWMGVVSRVPFDSHLVLNTNNETEDGCSVLLELAQRALSETGPIREAAAVALAAWLVRPDWEDQRLPQWIACAQTVLEPRAERPRNHLFLQLGCLHTIVCLLKISTTDRERLSIQLQSMSETLDQLSTSTSTMSSKLMDHYLVKWWTRWSCWHLPPPTPKRQQQRCLYSTGCTENASTKAKATTDEPITSEAIWEIPHFVEDAMDHLIRRLSHSATPVRWSAAKGIGRIASRLPAVAVEDVVEAVLSAPPDHGSCLALAELARRKLIQDPSRISLQQQLRHPSPVVRDAACYVYWALCRAYPPATLAPCLPAWNAAMIVTALLDREVNCRRAAAAAFQEAVGRQGARNVPHGLAILTSADYFSLGNRTNAFTVVAVIVARLSEWYCRAILRQLYTMQLFHDDVAIRKLSARALYHLTGLDTDYIANTVIPNLVPKCWNADVKIRHGSILAISECMQALLDSGLVVTEVISEPLLRRIVDLVPELEKRRLYRGRGGESVRLAVCRLIESMALCHIPLVVKEQVRLLDSIDGHIPHPNEEIQHNACKALHALLQEYFPVGAAGPSERLQKRVVDKFIGQATQSDNPSVTRGYCLALGSLPVKLIAPNDAVLSSVLGCLYRVARPAALVGKEGDAETRRNALKSLSANIDMASLPQRGISHVLLSPTQIEGISKAFLRSLDDYKTDARGDVGSWCRMEAMSGIVHLAMVSLDRGRQVPEALVTSAVQKILRQLVEKLDVVRIKAGECLEKLLLSDTDFSGKAELRDALGSLQSVDWRSTESVFSRSIRAILIPAYTRSIITGFSTSIGGLTEQVSATASRTLVSQIRACGPNEQHAIGLCFVDILQELPAGSRRLTLPILKALDVVFTNGCYKGMSDQDAGFQKSCLEAIHLAMVDSATVSHLFASIDVYTAIVGIAADDVAKKRGMSLLCRLLNNPYPRVRSYAADHMLLLDGVSSAIEWLVETPWVSETLPAVQLGSIVENIERALDIHVCAS